jgi:hypothetical protein
MRAVDPNQWHHPPHEVIVGVLGSLLCVPSPAVGVLQSARANAFDLVTPATLFPRTSVGNSARRCWPGTMSRSGFQGMGERERPEQQLIT